MSGLLESILVVCLSWSPNLKTTPIENLKIIQLVHDKIDRNVCNTPTIFISAHSRLFPSHCFTGWRTRSGELISVGGCGRFSAVACKLLTYTYLFFHGIVCVCMYVRTNFVDTTHRKWLNRFDFYFRGNEATYSKSWIVYFFFRNRSSKYLRKLRLKLFVLCGCGGSPVTVQFFGSVNHVL